MVPRGSLLSHESPAFWLFHKNWIGLHVGGKCGHNQMGDPSEILAEFQHLELVDNERVCKLGHGSILTCKLTHLRAPSRLMKSQLHLYFRASQKSKLNSSFYVAWQIDQGNAARESERTEQNVLENIPAVCSSYIAYGYWIDCKIHCLRNFLHYLLNKSSCIFLNVIFLSLDWNYPFTFLWLCLLLDLRNKRLKYIFISKSLRRVNSL